MAFGEREAGAVFWKTGFFASEYGVFENGRAILVDASAEAGMSGSPVIGFKKDQPKLLGVFGGRYSTDLPDHIGVVWLLDDLKQLG